MSVLNPGCRFRVFIFAFFRSARRVDGSVLALARGATGPLVEFEKWSARRRFPAHCYKDAIKGVFLLLTE